MGQRILITGSAGLIGAALRTVLEREHLDVVGFDVRSRGVERGDVRNEDAIRAAARRCTGIVHLAAVSRVAWGERDPEACWDTNVRGTHNVVAAALTQAVSPWLLFGSSREVYGHPEALPVTEEAPFHPVNVYGRSKAEGEAIVTAARERGLRGAILRFSNVYGSASDHPDRVVPAFARAAVLGAPLRVDGATRTFDFTHLDDTVRGIVALVRLLSNEAEAPPPIHLVSGVPITLKRLARLAVELAGTSAAVEEATPRAFDVSRFYGDPSRARALLGWTPRMSLRDGLAGLIESFRRELVPMASGVNAS